MVLLHSLKIVFRISRVERDNMQKRTLLEDHKLKLRLAKENSKSDSSTLVRTLLTLLLLVAKIWTKQNYLKKSKNDGYPGTLVLI